jgi:hypothetical protein
MLATSDRFTSSGIVRRNMVIRVDLHQRSMTTPLEQQPFRKNG